LMILMLFRRWRGAWASSSTKRREGPIKAI
jgi:hypothetical protein